ncbi:helix-turn-helix transcriptional regulator [Sphingomonas jatrophae]|uniref:AraC family transcriptional regulator n=1 Tax=Sphingomonas jatrophae TaxID=1166337 RepID=A0A1I6KFK3_9SPHN|nr:helix-turn-helix transcriptional regulator [Sphingomonas jatrophae]SFR90009.1 AraC family transcriptional regulator [Sphingomonas jatrophae]
MAPGSTTPSSGRRIETVDLVAELQSLDHPPYVEQVFTETLHTLALYNFRHVRDRAPTMARFRSRGAGSAFRQIGRIVTMPAGVPMEVRGDGGRVDAVRCQFTPALLSQISGRDHFATRGELDACTDVRGRAARLLLESLGRELAAPGFAAAAYAEAIGHALIVELARHLQGAVRPARVGAGLSPAQMAMLTDYIHAASRAPSLADVGALLGYSSRHVNRSFRRSTGQTLHSYIEDVRFQRACALLAGEDLLIKEVAWRLGFSCASNFAVAFRRRAGVSPQAYARLHGRAGIVAH